MSLKFTNLRWRWTFSTLRDIRLHRQRWCCFSFRCLSPRLIYLDRDDEDEREIRPTWKRKESFLVLALPSLTVLEVVESLVRSLGSLRSAVSVAHRRPVRHSVVDDGCPDGYEPISDTVLCLEWLSRCS